MRSALEAAAGVPVAMAVVVAIVALVRVPIARRRGPSELAAGLGLALEFLLAAGLVRLSRVADFAGLGVVAAIILVRRLLSSGIRAGVRALGGPPVRPRA